MKTLDLKPKKTILTTARVVSVEPSALSKSSGQNMVTKFKLLPNGPATSEAMNGINVYFTWNPVWYRPTFDPCSLSVYADKLKADIEAGDLEKQEEYTLLNKVLFAVTANYAADPGKEVSTMRGLVGGYDKESHNAAWAQLDAALAEIGAANPESEDESQEEAAQNAIVAGVDKLFAEFFGEDGPGGKYCCFTYGHKNERELDADGNQVYVPNKDGQMVPSWVPGKYRNVLKWVLPFKKTLASWRKSCESRGNIAFMIDEADPFGDGNSPF